MTNGLRIAAVLLMGLLTGAMLLISVVIVPFWRGLPADEFVLWFTSHAPTIGGLMVPLGAGGVLCTIVAAVVGRRQGARAALLFWVAAGAALVCGATYPIYYTEANAALGSGALPPVEVATELARWQVWHWVRIAAGGIAFAAGALGLLSAEGEPA